MRIAVVEDELSIQEMLTEYIDRYYAGKKAKYDLAVFSDGDEILERYSANYDLILLDIQMKRLDGMETARRIRQLDENVYLIFVTNMAQRAIQGYGVNALDFVLKPINYYMLEQLLQRVDTLMAKKKRSYITLPTDRGLMRLTTDQIYYVESVGHQIALHTERGLFCLRDTLKNMATMLEKHNFYRCNNCYLVNLAHVEQVNRTELVLAGKILSISRPRYKPFMEALTKYMGGAKG